MSRKAPELALIGLTGLPEIQAGDDLAALIVEAVRSSGVVLQPGDILVVTQKVVSKAEGRVVSLHDAVPSPLARRWAGLLAKDPRLV